MNYVASLACIGYTISPFLINFSSENVDEVIEQVNTYVKKWCKERDIDTSVEHDYLDIDETIYVKLDKNDISIINDYVYDFVTLAEDLQTNRLICLLNKI